MEKEKYQQSTVDAVQGALKFRWLLLLVIFFAGAAFSSGNGSVIDHDGLLVREYANLQSVNPNLVDTASEISTLFDLLDNELPGYAYTSGKPQKFFPGEFSSGISLDGAFRITGQIYLQAGNAYVFSAQLDDATVLKLNGTEILNVPHDFWGVKLSSAFVPDESGYYEIDWAVYNGVDVGMFKPYVSVNGLPKVELNSNHFDLKNVISFPNFDIVTKPPVSDGLLVRQYAKPASVDPEIVDTEAELRNIFDLLSSEIPKASYISKVPQIFVGNWQEPYGLSTDSAFRLSGYIFLNAGKSYVFSCYMDDAAILKVNEQELMNLPHDNWGMKTSSSFTPTADGFYSIDWVVYNGANHGAFKPLLSVDGGLMQDLTSRNFILRSNLAWSEGEFVSITFGYDSKPVMTGEYKVRSNSDSYSNLITHNGEMTEVTFDASLGANTMTSVHFGNDSLSYLPWISPSMNYDAAIVLPGQVSTYSFRDLPAGTYKLILGASRNVSAGDGSRITRYSITKGQPDNQFQLLDVANPLSGTVSPHVEFIVSPDAGVISFTFEAAQGARFGYLGAAILVKLSNENNESSSSSSISSASSQSSSPSSQSSSSSSQPTHAVALTAKYFGYREGVDGNNLETISAVTNFINGRSPDATFVATQLNYGAADLFGNDLGAADNLQRFLQSDATSLNLDPDTTSDSIILMNGEIHLAAGTYNFRVLADDGYRIKIDGVVVAEVDNIQSPTGTIHPPFSLADGQHQIEILYWDQGGQAVLKVEISRDGGNTYQYLNQPWSSSSQSSIGSQASSSSSKPNASNLTGEYFGYREDVDGLNLITIEMAESFINGRLADATFVATKLSYGIDDRFENDLGRGLNLQRFLGSDAASLSIDPPTTSDAIIRMHGQINLSAGTYNFRVLADDGYRIKIDGVTVAEVSLNQSPTTTVHDSFTIGSGTHLIEILYWDQGLEAAFQVEVSRDGGNTYQLLSQSDQSQSGSSSSAASANWVANEYIVLTFGYEEKPYSAGQYRVKSSADSFSNLKTFNDKLTGVNFDASRGANTSTGPHYGNDLLHYLPWITGDMNYDAAYLVAGKTGIYSFTNLSPGKYKLILGASRNVARGDGSRLTQYSVVQGSVEGSSEQLMDAANPESGSTSPFVEFVVFPQNGIISFSFEAGQSATYGYLGSAVLIKLSNAVDNSWMISKINDNNDDVRQDPDGLWPNAFNGSGHYFGNDALAHEGNYFGVWWDVKQYPGLRFQIDAANKSSQQIADAKLVLYSNGTSQGNPRIRVVAEKNNNCAPWSTTHLPTDIINSTRTIAYKDYQALDILYSDYREGEGSVSFTQLMTINVTDIIQELASLPGWIGEDGAICITADPLDSEYIHEAGFRDFYHSPTEAAELHIRYAATGSDLDGDGIGDDVDTDRDGDGYLNDQEIALGTDPNDPASKPSDIDNDGIPDALDNDRDGDGYSNDQEIALGTNPNDSTSRPSDLDNDGIPDLLDQDRDGDGHNNDVDSFPNDATEWSDLDSDGIGDNKDTDRDGDGYSNDLEIAEGSDPNNAASKPQDIDNDGIPDSTDIDRDGDGYNNDLDKFPNDASEWSDLDNDGIGDNSDTDRDGDGYSNDQEIALGTDPNNPNNKPSDLDNDGIPDVLDDDRDGDGHNNDVDSFPNDATEWSDLDSDGIGDNKDTDRDGDGYSNDLEIAEGSDPNNAASKPQDIDNDGIPDSTDIDRDGDGYNNDLDKFPNDASEWSDLDNDGIGDNSDTDRDGDGYSNDQEIALGTNPNDANSKPSDLDNDGIPDALDDDRDGDGRNNDVDSFPNDATEWSDLDSDGIGDNKDTDRDGDGYSNDQEIAAGTDPNNAASKPADMDNDGIPDALDDDRDGDGYNNNLDLFPNDTTEWSDLDADGVGDNKDTDRDGDGFNNIIEEQKNTDPNSASDYPDIIAPLLTILNVADEQVNVATVILRGNVSDTTQPHSGVATIKITNDRYPNLVVDATASNNLFEQSVPLAIGSNLLTTLVSDFSGNISQATHRVTRLAAAKFVSVTPADGSVVQSQTINIAGQIESSRSSDEIRFFINEWQVTPDPTASADRYQFALPNVQLQLGQNNFLLRLETPDGIDERSLIVHYQPENPDSIPAPELSILSPVSGSQLSDASFLIKGRAISHAGNLSIRVNGQTIASSSANNQLEYFETLLSFANGANSLQVNIEATDVLNKTTRLIATYYRDSLAPQIQLQGLSVSPAINSIVQSPTLVSGIITDLNLASATLNNQALPLQPTAQPGIYSFNLPVTITPGEQTSWILAAYDFSGNRTSVEYVFQSATEIGITALLPADKSSFLSTGEPVKLQVAARVSEVPAGTSARLLVNNQAIALTLTGTLATGEVTLPAAAASYQLQYQVIDSTTQVLASSVRNISVFNQDSIEVELVKHQPENAQQNIEPNQPLEFYFNKTIDLSKLNVSVRETLHGHTYIDVDDSGADFLSAKGYQLQEVHRDSESVSGSIALLPGSQTVAFYPSRQFGFNAEVYVDLMYDNKSLSRFYFKVRQLPTFVMGGVVDHFGQPLAGITVTLPELNRTAITNGDGAFAFGFQEPAGNEIPGGQYKLVVNPELKNPRFGVQIRKINLQQGRKNEIGIYRVTELSGNAPFQLISSGQTETSFVGDELKLDLSDARLLFDSNGATRTSGNIQFQFMPFDQLDAPSMAGAVPLWMYAAQPRGVRVEGEVGINIKAPMLRGSYDYLNALNRYDEKYLVLLGFDSEREVIQPVGIGRLENYRVISVGKVSIQNLDYFGYALVNPELQPLLKEIAEGRKSLQQLLIELE
jgi:Bacterial TSP3 repeat